MFSERMKVALIILLGMAALYGCGQKGPLYLPTETAVEQEEPASDTDEQEDT